MVRWPGHVAPEVSDALVSQVDLFASLSAFVSVEYRSQDSQNQIESLLGNDPHGRSDLVIEGLGRTAYRNGDYVMIPPYEGPAITPWGPDIELGIDSEYQLYDLANDPGQQRNLAFELPEKLEEMKGFYSEIIGPEDE